MLIKEFAEKYHIDYSVVYNATWLTKPTNTSFRYKEYEERDLLTAVRKLITQRIERHEESILKEKEMLEKVTL